MSPNVSLIHAGFTLACWLSLARGAQSHSKAWQSWLPEFEGFCSAGSTGSPHLLWAPNFWQQNLLSFNYRAALDAGQQQKSLAFACKNHKLACKIIDWTCSAWKDTWVMFYGFQHKQQRLFSDNLLEEGSTFVKEVIANAALAVQ